MHGRLRPLTCRVPRASLRNVRVFRVDCGSEAKREAGAMLRVSIKTGAAPATVNGELLSLDATGARRHGEGETAATTCKPGDLP